MDEGRLKAVRRSQKIHRKFAYALNDTIRNRQESYQNCLSREEQETNTRLVSKVMGMRKAVVRNRVLLQCLSLQRQVPQERARSEPVLGRYGGRPIKSFSRDIDQRLAWFHPKLRRLRQVDRVKQTCLKQGAILDEETVKERMEDFFSRNLPTLSHSSSPLDDLLRDGKSGVEKHRHDDYDDDDFDIRDFHDPIGAANIKLKLHPFGNLVDTNQIATRNVHSPSKWDVYRNTSYRSSRTGEGELGRASSPLKGVLPSGKGNDCKESANSWRSYGPKKEALHPSPSRTNGNCSPKLSKYSKPLPAIASVTESDIRKEGGAGNKDPHISHSQTSSIAQRMSHRNNAGQESTRSQEKAATPTQRRSPARDAGPHQEEREDGRPTLTRRKTLVLPPIETSKDMAKKKH